MSGRFFGSDNSATVHPAVMEALNEANRGHAKAYGEDEWTQAADRVFKEIFGPAAEVAEPILGKAAFLEDRRLSGDDLGADKLIHAVAEVQCLRREAEVHD